MMQVVVLGSGALGSLYAASSVEAGHDVCIVCRPAHAQAVNDRGLTVNYLDGTSRTVRMDAVTDASLAPEADVVLLASKANDTAPLLEAYRGTPDAAWGIQNGARQAEPLVKRFGSAALACSSMIGATLLEPGLVAHTFTGSTYLGRLQGSSEASLDLAVGSLSELVSAEVREDIASVLWSKAVLASAAMGMSVLLRLCYHRLFLEPGAREVFLDIASDAAEIAGALGVELVDLPGPLQAGSLMSLPRPEALQRLAAVGQNMLDAGQTSVKISMLQSLESGRRLEVQAVFGDLIELADEHDLEVPLLRSLTRIVTMIDDVTGQAAEPEANNS